MHIEPIAADAATEARARFTIAARPLADAVKLLSGKVTERRNTIPILSTLLIEASPCGHVTITATDLDIWATVTLQADPSEEIEPGALCLDAGALSDAMAKAHKASDSVRLVAGDDYRATLKAGRGEFKLRGLPRDDFPMPKAAELDCAGVLDRAQFLADLKALAPAVSTEPTRYYLNGYAIQARDMAGRDSLVMVATNGSNMAAASRPMPEGLEGWQDAIIPRKFGAVMLAAAKLAGDAENLTLSRFGGKIAATLGSVSIVSKLIDGTFPDWPRAFEGMATPTSESETALFPDMMPGRPLAAMEALSKAAPVAIDWQEGDKRYFGAAAGDPGLAWCAMMLAADNEPRKGYRYSEGNSRDHARSYLKALAETQGLPGAETFAAECERLRESDFDGYASSLCHLETQGGRVLGLTIGGNVRHYARRETVRDWEALCDRTIEIPARDEAMEGSYSILMPADGPVIEHDYSVTVEGDRRYPVAVNSGATKIHLSKEQVAALCGDSLWDVLEFPGADGKPRYVSQWLWDDGATRLLCVGKDGRCPKAGAVREYVTRAQVEAALAGDVAAPVMIEAPAPIAAEPIAVASEAVQERAEPVPAPTDSAEAPASNPEPVSCQPVSDSDPIAAVRMRLAEIEALLATLSAETERPKRTPAHERAIRRAWAERKARRDAEKHLRIGTGQYEHIKAELERVKALEACTRNLASEMSEESAERMGAAKDRARLAEQEAAEALAMREELQRILAATEARLEAAESENAQLWGELEALTAPETALAA